MSFSSNSIWFTTALTGVGVLFLAVFLRLDWENARLILMELRFPRILLAIAVGGALALSGAVLQTLLGNPLAEPYTLGVASGAALGAAVFSSIAQWIFLPLEIAGLNLGGIIGALGVVWILFKLMSGSGLSSGALVLTGVMLSLTCGSLLAIWMALADPVGVQSVHFWLLGDLSRVGWGPSLLVLGVSIVSLVYFVGIARKLDAFLLGSHETLGFGINPQTILRSSVLVLSILIGMCVCATGLIGFLGLMTPHLVRKKTGNALHRRLLPLVYVWGAWVLLASDTLARATAFPHELPVGAVTAMVGAPIFILLYRRQRQGERDA